MVSRGTETGGGGPSRWKKEEGETKRPKEMISLQGVDQRGRVLLDALVEQQVRSGIQDLINLDALDDRVGTVEPHARVGLGRHPLG